MPVYGSPPGLRPCWRTPTCSASRSWRTWLATSPPKLVWKQKVPTGSDCQIFSSWLRVSEFNSRFAAPNSGGWVFQSAQSSDEIPCQQEDCAPDVTADHSAEYGSGMQDRAASATPKNIASLNHEFQGLAAHSCLLQPCPFVWAMAGDDGAELTEEAGMSCSWPRKPSRACGCYVQVKGPPEKRPSA